MKCKKISDLEQVKEINNEDLFAVSTKKGDEFESGSVSFRQIKNELDVVQILESPTVSDEQQDVYISINGYQVAAKRTQEVLTDVSQFPTNIARIIPVINQVTMRVGILYIIPFVAHKCILSDNLTVHSNKDAFTILTIHKIDDTYGYIKAVSYQQSDYRWFLTTIYIKDQSNGVLASISVEHETEYFLGFYISDTKISDDNKKIKLYISGWFYTYNNNPGVIQPKITLSENIKHHVSFRGDYFNQLYLNRHDKADVPNVINLILDEPYQGDLTIVVEDLLHPFSESKTVSIDYKG